MTNDKNSRNKDRKITDYKFHEVKGDEVGVVMAESTPSEFTMTVKPDSTKMQEFLVAEHPLIPDKPVLVEVIAMGRQNPLLPVEAAQEFALQTGELYETVLSTSEHLELLWAKCKVIGFINEHNDVENPKYPTGPGSKIHKVKNEFLQDLFESLEFEKTGLYIGELLSNKDVKVKVNGNMLVHEHVTILAKTGVGKTYAAGNLIDELMKKGYPLVVFDIHGDYDSIRKPDGRPIRKVAPHLEGSQLEFDELIGLIENLSGEPIKPAQRSVISLVLGLLEDVKSLELFKNACESLVEKYVDFFLDWPNRDLYALATVVNWCIEIREKEDRLEEEDRRKIKDLKEKVPKFKDLYRKNIKTLEAVTRELFEAAQRNKDKGETIDIYEELKKNRFIVLGLKDLNRDAQIANTVHILESLLELGKNKKIPGVVVLIEEAHNFAPSNKPAPSLDIMKTVATEGRKFGISMIVISQRPSMLDQTVLSQCSSQIILKIINPNDQNQIRASIETLGSEELNFLPNLSKGEAILAGSFVPFPIPVRIRKRSEYMKETYKRENYFENVKDFKWE